MRICKISEVLTRVGEQISGVSGTLKSIYKAKTGDGKYGPWSLQDAVLADESGEMTITFANFDGMDRLRGMKVTITAKQGDKGLSGLIVKESEYNGKKYIKLHITGSAMIDSGVTHESDPVEKESCPPEYKDADPEELAALELLAKKKAEKEAARLQADAKVRAQAASALPSRSLSSRDVQIVNLFRKALKGAVWACDKEKVPFYTESVATLFIAMRDDNLTDCMPVEFEKSNDYIHNMDTEKALQKAFQRESTAQSDPAPEIDQEPRTWGEVVVHVDGPYKGFPLGVMKTEAILSVFHSFKPKINQKTNNYDLPDLYLLNALNAWKKEQPL